MFCRNSLVLLLLGAGLSGLAQALPDDRGQPVHISADSAVQENTTVTYRGNVVVTQGSLRLDADQVVVHHATGKVQKIVATGKPAHFQQQPEVNGGIVKATAATLVYYQAENRFELLQDALVERDGSSVKGNRIEYLPNTQTVRAQGSLNSQNGRVEMILPPEQLSDDKTPPPPAPVEQ
ncbi:MAG: lipopolysaccharide transport periplasmic protein LptA [Spongiibacteraceae bacterium]